MDDEGNVPIVDMSDYSSSRARSNSNNRSGIRSANRSSILLPHDGGDNKSDISAGRNNIGGAVNLELNQNDKRKKWPNAGEKSTSPKPVVNDAEPAKLN